MTQIHKYTKTQIQILLYCADLSSDILCRHLRFLCLALLGRSKRRPRGQTRSMMMMILIETIMMMMLIETMMMMMMLIETRMLIMMMLRVIIGGNKTNALQCLIAFPKPASQQ